MLPRLRRFVAPFLVGAVFATILASIASVSTSLKTASDPLVVSTYIILYHSRHWRRTLACLEPPSTLPSTFRHRFRLDDPMSFPPSPLYFIIVFTMLILYYHRANLVGTVFSASPPLQAPQVTLPPGSSSPSPITTPPSPSASISTPTHNSLPSLSSTPTTKTMD